jgi:hypothetical protein
MVDGEGRKLWLVLVLAVAALVGGATLIRRTRRRARNATVDFADDADYVDASEYERLTGVAKESYEQRLLTEARALLMREWTVEPDDGSAYTRRGVSEHGSVDDVGLDGEGPDTALVVLFRCDARPGRVFGWRVPVWPTSPPDDPDEGTPEGSAFILSVNLPELIDHPDRLPAYDPDARGITWIVN